MIICSRPFDKRDGSIFFRREQYETKEIENKMKWMGLNEIREKFLSFYESKGHLRMPSFSLVPSGDNSLLLINSGMAPLKPYFTGVVPPPRSRATTCQKCIRTPDIERVGKTARHGTFFEMLGNFSFGDYFKREATAWAYEFATKVMELPAERIYISVYEEDDEAREIWVNEVGVDPSHIVKMGKEDNFWEIGTGPCGPCSELYFDRGEKYGCGKPDCGVGCECDRFIEFWNLVFTQFDSDGKGNYTKLAHPNIDTGMGLERLATIMQDVDNIFEVDTIANVLKKAAEIAGVKYGEKEESDVSLRVVTDHIRSTTFLISDGVLPSNEGRGYVLRRLLRRAARHGRLLGITRPFLAELCDVVIKESGGAYPELVEKADYIKKVISEEEARFDQTISEGLRLLGGIIEKSDGKEISGADCFKLYDTFGFPIDLTIEIAEEKGLTCDIEGFEQLMKEQKERARSAREKAGGVAWNDALFEGELKLLKTEFVGYTESACEATLRAIVKDGALSESLGDGESAGLVLDRTVFYAESGGQVGDTGVISGEGFTFEVSDCKKLPDGKFLHIGTLTEGSCRVGTAVRAEINLSRRRDIMRNHSSAHLLQAALRRVLGSHVEQAGSYVDGERMRFDFTHFSAVTKEEQREIERLVNESILDAVQVDVMELPIEEAKKLGATALFGEKYGDIVRVVKMGDVSVEFCGGTHVHNTAEVGLFHITSESSVAAGVRRIEAVTGRNLIAAFDEQSEKVEHTAHALKTTPVELLSRAESLMAAQKELQSEIESLKAKIAGSRVDELLSHAEQVGEYLVLCETMEGASADELRAAGDALRERMPNIAAVLAGSANLVAICGKECVKRGAAAGAVVKECAKLAGGGGGGRPDSAMAGVKDKAKIPEALAHAREMLKAALS